MMDFWLAAEIGAALAMALSGAAVLHLKRLSESVVALQIASVLVSFLLMILGETIHRPSLFSYSLAIALLSFPAALTLGYLMERWFP